MLRVPLLDALIAGTLIVIGIVEALLGSPFGGIGAATSQGVIAQLSLTVVVAAAVAFRRRVPMPALGVVCAAIVVQVVAVAPYVPLLTGLLPLVITLYTATAYGPRWRIVALVAAFATEAVFTLRIPEEHSTGEVLFGVFVLLGTWAIGDVVHGRLADARNSVLAAERALADREAEAAAELADEHKRIARELHDVIAHSVSVMGVQAGAARTLLDTDREAARAAIGAVETTARSAVAELGRLLTVMRDGPEQDDLMPQPGLSGVPALIQRVRAAGLPVQFSTSVDRPLPLGLELAAYRIVQESLTNALKHAGTPTEVALAVRGDDLCIEVRTEAAGEGGPNAAAGHGLLGMRERAQLYGGTLVAGPQDRGDFLVQARLPVSMADAS